MSAHDDDSLHMATAALTLRDYFAAQAMQGICAGRDEIGQLIAHGYAWIAHEAYTIADAMLAERAKGQE